jgi:CyaY protein
MDDKEFAARCQQEIAMVEAAVEAAADDSDIDFEMQEGILEIECADGSKVIVSPHAIAKEIWVAAKSGGFHFRFDAATERWIDTRSGDSLRARLVEILKQQGQVALNLR